MDVEGARAHLEKAASMRLAQADARSEELGELRRISVLQQ
jgi:hypothetical protein